jgi:hypothetical protein
MALRFPPLVKPMPPTSAAELENLGHQLPLRFFVIYARPGGSSYQRPITCVALRVIEGKFTA